MWPLSRIEDNQSRGRPAASTTHGPVLAPDDRGSAASAGRAACEAVERGVEAGVPGLRRRAVLDGGHRRGLDDLENGHLLIVLVDLSTL